MQKHASLSLADHLHQNVCTTLRLHHEDADEEPRIGHDVQPHRSHQRAAVQQRRAGQTHDGGLSAAWYHGHGAPLHDGKLSYQKWTSR